MIAFGIIFNLRNQVMMIDIESLEWLQIDVQLGQLPGLLEHHRFFCAGAKLYIMGGYINGFGASDKMWVFHINT